MPSFSYVETPFNSEEQIRLLTLFPATKATSENENGKTSPLRTSLQPFDWNDTPSYVALSYTWGDATQIETILVNDRTLDITASLYEALLHMQTDEPLLVWVDAICINQKDNQEKTAQVKRMTEIYKAAASVFAWLGPATDDSDAAMAALVEIGEDAIEAGQLRLSRETMLKLWDPDPEGLLESVRQPFIDLSERIGVNFPQLEIKSLSERSYFTRTWIVQEFSVATNLVIACGKRRLTFPQLSAGFLFLALHRVLTVDRLASITKATDPEASKRLSLFIKNCEGGAPCRLVGSRNRYQKQRPEYHSSMLELLSLVSSYTNATDPRDKVFGLLGVAPDAETLDIKVDYSKKAHEVFEDTARALLKSGFTDVLSWTRSRLKSEINLPTWVPDFSSSLPEPLGSYKCRAPPWKPLFSASGTREVQVSTNDKPGQLTMSGFIVDTIEEVGTPWKVENCQQTATLLDLSLDTLLGEIFGCCQLAQQKSPPISNDPQFWEEALWRIPCADQQWHQYTRRRAKPEAKAGLMEIIERNSGELSGYRDEVKKAAWRKYHLAMQCLYDFRPFISNKGYPGMAPEFAAPGDLICMIFGAICPYVLRKVENGFELIGESYVHGIMDGEGMSMGLEETAFCFV
ncbi:heterokaryon incompatibility protein-domain-containing protein [Leptodontidium sp. MPI-SDFR-AT-0119]|nr:heterokaryon incompatibility protein-domain-containing protein [Leptodontidium sp. MPI-SDFR-AT-0119]